MVLRANRDLIERAAAGDEAARNDLLSRYRDDIRRMVAVRLDRRIAPRIDASDVTQETLAAASDRLDEYVRDCPLTFFGWLRQIASDRVIDVHRRHLDAQRRTVSRESRFPEMSDDSALDLGQRFVSDDTSPSNRLLREERRERVRNALAELSARHREILVMRFLEHLCSTEIGEALGISEGAVESRVVRALARLRILLENGA
jgi:RNA polymerase sigma-70 factor (ECF subfamily)